ncbi:MAG: Ig-like domain-containing protein [Synergistaceae bacterium]|jgi:predicted outer membrane repeat protein|nr:Ig-like domain-containing protein [Synergistaceae bacterium]
MKRCVSILLGLLLALLALGADRAVAATHYVTDSAELAAAVLDPASSDITLSADITLNIPINISAPVTIHGNNTTLTVDSANKISVNLTGVVTFDGLRVIGVAPATGGAISVSGGTLNLNGGSFSNITGGDVVVINNANANFNGGSFLGISGGNAVTIAYSNASFSGLGFSNVSGGSAVAASNSTVRFESVSFNSISNARAVSIAGGTVTFGGSSSFNNNSRGGVDIGMGSVVSFNGTSFFRNGASSGLDGGAVAVSGSGSAEFTDAKFSENRAVNGGAVSVVGGSASFRGTGTEFSSNTAAANGGAVSATGRGQASFEGTAVFRNNTAGANGGALYASEASLSIGSAFTFEGNTATGGDGGAIWTDGAFSVPGGTFASNKAAAKGGAIYAAGNITIAAGVFRENSTTANSPAPDDGGGAVYSMGALRITGGTFTSNTSGKRGGAAWGETVTVGPASTPVEFSGNTVTGVASTVSMGGALFANSTNTGTQSSMSVRDAIFTGNSSTSAGGAVASLGTANIVNCVFGDGGATTNVAERTGGAVYSEYAVVSNSTFIKNVAYERGGAVFVNGGGPGNRSSFENVLFAMNISSVEGGAFYSGGGGGHELTFLCSYFDSNSTSGSKGGAIYSEGSSLFIKQCTFSKNSASEANSAGGAVWTGAIASRILNSTFVENSVGGGSGGAVYFDSTVTAERNSAIYYSTFLRNVAGGGKGGAFFSKASGVNVGASLFVGNTAGYGMDIYRDIGTINSAGYNIINNYGISGASGQPNPSYNWTADPSVTGSTNTDKYGDTHTAVSIFGSNVLTSNPVNGTPIVVGSSHQPERYLDTIALVDSTETSLNPAIDQIVGNVAWNLFNTYFAGNSHTDQRGFSRPNNSDGFSDIGAFENERGTPGGPYPPGPVVGSIAFIRMSGIPLTMKTVGQTCTLTAVVYYQNGTQGFNESVSWSSSNPAVAVIDQYGNVYSYSRGSTTISVQTDRPAADGNLASDSADLVIENDMMNYMNVFPGVRRRLAEFNSGLGDSGTQFYFLDTDPEELKQSSFSSRFESAYGVEGFQISEITDALQLTVSEPRERGASQLKPAIGLSMPTLASPGGLIPLRYSYNLTWEEISDILGRTVDPGSVMDDVVKELFDNVSLEFADENGESRTVIGSGAGSVSAGEAKSSESLSYERANSSLHLQVDVLMGDARYTGEAPEYMIGNKIVLADNSANGNIKGQLSLVSGRGTDTDVTGSGGGGGGGCNGGIAPAALALCASILAGYIGRSRR